MRVVTALASTAAWLLPACAMGQAVDGLYVGAGAGANFMPHETVDKTTRLSAFTFNPATFGPNAGSAPASSSRGVGRLRFDPGGVGVGSIGYGFGNGLRVEVEGSYRYNGSDPNRLSEQKFGGLANALFDFDVGSPRLFPYLGVGAGYQWADRGFHDGRTGSFAYQAILGVATPVTAVPGLSVTLEYRFLGLAGSSRQNGVPPDPLFGQGSSTTTKFSDDYNHSILLGARYAFNTPPPLATPVPVPADPAPAPTRTYLVFFDWDRADLSDRARQIIAEAAQASRRVQYTRIEVQGNADASGTPAYNQGLSLRRAQSVAAELVRNGVPRTAIGVQAFGDSRPLVPTAAGVREPQNRRVAILLR